MNSLRNSVRLIGHLGEDPQVKKLQSGSTLANFYIATNEVYKNNKGEKMEQTNWHRLVAWGKQAEIAGNVLKKGVEVAIDGRLSQRSYEDKNGIKQYITEVVVNNFLMMDRKQQG